MPATNARVSTLITKPLLYTPYDVKWVPSSARFCVIGANARGHGVIAVYEIDGKELQLTHEVEKPSSFKCGTFGASTLYTRHLATGNFAGDLQLWDLERTEIPILSIKAHGNIIHAIDGCGGASSPNGAPELATASRDGTVKVWDLRQREKPVITVRSGSKDMVKTRDVWCVAFGNAHSDTERALAAGYDNGDIKLFDLRTISSMWETNTNSGICSLEFAKTDAPMSRLVATTLDSFHIFDLTTLKSGPEVESKTVKPSADGTVWTVRHLLQDPTIFATTTGDGSVQLYRHDEGPLALSTLTVSPHPVTAFDWSPDKRGLCVFSAFDQNVRVGFVSGV
ncbi:WD40-repeat-containing domain protein [Endogone sp. FLAS-F59071]|nr:WD40-repeat-containing domain protein [Endogone sp. FLAS-F59071]|eukprot:RUS21678.1 WD40-repeat-containing domain protein [Endogone sp. FLAS-F59071]